MEIICVFYLLFSLGLFPHSAPLNDKPALTIKINAIMSRNPVAIERTLFSPTFFFNRATRAQHVIVAINNMGISEIQKLEFFRIRISVITRSVRAARSWFDAPKTGHVWFLTKPADMLPPGLATRAAPGERFALGPGAFYLHAPDGIGRSKLAANVEHEFGQPATARNLNTLNQLAALLDGMQE